MTRVLALASALVVLGLTTLAGSAAAADSGTLIVQRPCGCVLFEDGFPAGITGGLPVGDAPYTPAQSNPSGTATFTP
jgi:hypothetical protein